MARADSYSLLQNGTKKVSVLENDMSLGDQVKISSVSVPDNGVAEIDGDNSIIYSPMLDYFGVDNFVCQVTASNGGSSSVTVTLQIKCLVNCSYLFKVSWELSISPDVVGYKAYVGGYKAYVGKNNHSYSDVITVETVTQFDYLAEEKGTFYFAVSAVNQWGMESELAVAKPLVF